MNFDADSSTPALALLGASAVGWVGAPFAGKYASAVRVAAVAVGVLGAYALWTRIQAKGGLAGLVTSAIQAPLPTTEVVSEVGGLPVPPIVNPGAAAGNEFLRLSASILSPAEGETLHARGELIARGTYPVDILLRNDRSTDAEGFLQVETVEDTLFGAPATGGVTSDLMRVPARSVRRITLHVPAASGRASLGIEVVAQFYFVHVVDNRKRDLGRREFLVT